MENQTHSQQAAPETITPNAEPQSTSIPVNRETVDSPSSMPGVAENQHESLRRHAAPSSRFTLKLLHRDPANAELKAIVRKFAGAKPDEHAAAEAWIRNMDVPQLMRLIAYERRLRRRRWVLFGTVIAVLLLFAVSGHVFNGFLWWKVLAGAGATVAMARTQKAGVLALAEMNDPAAIGELILALQIPDSDVQRTLRPTLTRLFPRLGFHDSALLKEPERAVLRKFMEGSLRQKSVGYPGDSEDEILLSLSVLKALEQIGDSSFVPIVTQWGGGHYRGHDPRVQQAAQECLPYLEAAIANRQASQEFLRASSADTGVNADELLRPAADTSGASSENLLRPSSPA